MRPHRFRAFPLAPCNDEQAPCPKCAPMPPCHRCYCTNTRCESGLEQVIPRLKPEVNTAVNTAFTIRAQSEQLCESVRIREAIHHHDHKRHACSPPQAKPNYQSILPHLGQLGKSGFPPSLVKFMEMSETLPKMREQMNNPQAFLQQEMQKQLNAKMGGQNPMLAMLLGQMKGGH